ncbi:MAG: DNA cytosine methyltransferase [bacterium]
MSKPTVISLFSGAGGLDFGFEAAGFETSVAVEMNHDACETLRANRKWPVIERDIMEVTTAEMLEQGGLKAGDVDVLIGGPPCQPFSKSGYWAHGDAKRLDDPRSNTLGAYLRVLEEAKPRAFLLENVEGMAFRGKDEGLRLLMDAFVAINKRAKTNYKPVMRLLNAADYGVPQLRKRVIIVGARDGKELTFPEPTHTDQEPDLFTRLAPRMTAWDAIGDVPLDPHEQLDATGRWADLLPSIPEGQNYQFHTDRGAGKNLFGWRRHYWTFLLKLAKNQPSWTIQAQPGPAAGPFHWDNRRLSHRELCRLQTFPDDVVVTGTRLAIQKQIGNAVPSLLAEVLAGAISTQLLGRRTRSELKLLRKPATSTPKAARATRVPRKYHNQIGEHLAHPGTGRGHAAVQRSLQF